MADHLVIFQARFGTKTVPVLDIATTADDKRRIRHCYPNISRGRKQLSQILEQEFAGNPADSPNWGIQVVVVINVREELVGEVHDWVLDVLDTIGGAGDRYDLFVTDDINETPVEWKWKYPDCRLDSIRPAPHSTGRTKVTITLTAGGAPVENP